MTTNRFRNCARLALWAAVSAACTALPARADFSEGLEAFDAGDYAAALEEWRPLAAAGDGDAQLALAGMYRLGVGVPRNSARAADLYRAAALQGHVSGQLNLGDFYATGTGVKRDLVRAHAWLSLAARRHHAWAIGRLAEVAAAMTAQEIAEAERLANQLVK